MFLVYWTVTVNYVGIGVDLFPAWSATHILSLYVPAGMTFPKSSFHCL